MGDKGPSFRGASAGHGGCNAASGMRATLLLLAFTTGCAMGGGIDPTLSGEPADAVEPAATELDACAVEDRALDQVCTDYGDDSIECEDAAASVRAACFLGGKADGPSDLLGRMWINDGRACYEARDLDCLRGHFRKLVRGWRYVYWYPQAARAMENFLDCEQTELTIPREAFEADLDQNRSFPEALSVGQLLDQTRAEARAQAAAATEDLETFDLGAPLVVPKSDNVRFAVGRTTVQTTADFVRGDSRSWLTIHYSFRDRYDFHPDRIDEHSTGLTYTDAFPYHAWAAALVEAGQACEFDHVGSWEETFELP